MIKIRNPFMAFVTMDVLLTSLALFATPAYKYIPFLSPFQCKAVALVLMALGVFLYMKYVHPSD